MQFEINTSKREEIFDITEKIKEIVEKNSNKESNACLVYTPHATAGIIVNENYDKLVCSDILNYLKNQIPQGKWKHDKIDNNADSHIKSSILGCSEIIPIENKKLLLGTWQGIGFVELDGPKTRKIIVKIL
jgi:secondary thiamine-phosphate synthase enzyme